MKLVFFCLFAVCCSSLASATDTKEMRKLQEVMAELMTVKKILKNNETMLNIPPKDIGDCCGLSALKCFQTNLNQKFNITQRTQGRKGKLYRSLGNSFTESGLNATCTSGNAQPNCPACALHPEGNVRDFFDSLETLIQKAITKLSMQ